MYTNQNNYSNILVFQVVIPAMIFFFNSIPSDLFYLNIHIVIVKVIMITGCFAMYSITITITCNHKNQ